MPICSIEIVAAKALRSSAQLRVSCVEPDGLRSPLLSEVAQYLQAERLRS